MHVCVHDTVDRYTLDTFGFQSASSWRFPGRPGNLERLHCCKLQVGSCVVSVGFVGSPWLFACFLPSFLPCLFVPQTAKHWGSNLSFKELGSRVVLFLVCLFVCLIVRLVACLCVCRLLTVLSPLPPKQWEEEPLCSPVCEPKAAQPTTVPQGSKQQRKFPAVHVFHRVAGASFEVAGRRVDSRQMRGQVFFLLP